MDVSAKRAQIMVRAFMFLSEDRSHLPPPIHPTVLPISISLFLNLFMLCVVQSDSFSIPLPVSHLGLDFLSEVRKTTAGGMGKNEKSGQYSSSFIHPQHPSTIVRNKTTVRTGAPAQRLLKARKALSLRRRANKRV